MATVNSYEIVMVYSMKNGEEAAKALLEKFKALIEANGTVEQRRRVGKTPLGVSHQRRSGRLLCAG